MASGYLLDAELHHGLLFLLPTVLVTWCHVYLSDSPRDMRRVRNGILSHCVLVPGIVPGFWDIVSPHRGHCSPVLVRLGDYIYRACAL